MKFNDKWPTVKPGQDPIEALGLSSEDYHKLPEGPEKFRLGHYLRAKESDKCWICGEETSWIEINFEGYCCSEECDDKGWADYKQACRDSDHKELDDKEW